MNSALYLNYYLHIFKFLHEFRAYIFTFTFIILLFLFETILTKPFNYTFSQYIDMTTKGDEYQQASSKGIANGMYIYPMLDKNNFPLWQESLLTAAAEHPSLLTLLLTGIEQTFEVPVLTTMEGDNRVRKPEYADPEAGVTIWKSEYDAVIKKRTYYFEVAKPRMTSRILGSLDASIRTILTQEKDYQVKVQEADVLWIYQRCEFIATGHGGASIGMDVLALIEIKGDATNVNGFSVMSKQFTDVANRLLGRDADKGKILEAVMDALFVMKLQSFPELDTKRREIYTKTVWPSRTELIPSIQNFLTTVTAAEKGGDPGHGQLKAHLTRLEQDTLELAQLQEKEVALRARIGESRNTLMNRGIVSANYGPVEHEAFASTASKKYGEDTKICFNCGKKGHLYKDCSIRPASKCTVDGCGGNHHTSTHHVVKAIEARRDRTKRTQQPWAMKKKQIANLSSAEQWSEDTFDAMDESYCSMVQGFQTSFEDLDDNIDFEALATILKN